MIVWVDSAHLVHSCDLPCLGILIWLVLHQHCSAIIHKFMLIIDQDMQTLLDVAARADLAATMPASMI